MGKFTFGKKSWGKPIVEMPDIPDDWKDTSPDTKMEVW
jgi:hypothetical protein